MRILTIALLMRYLIITILITSLFACNYTVDSASNEYEIENGILYLTTDQLTTENGLNDAYEACDKGKAAATISLPFGSHVISYNVRAQANISLKGVKGTKLILASKDTNTPAIEVVRENRFYVENASIENIDFITESPIETVIKTGRTHNFRIINCNFDLQNKAATAIQIGSEDEEGSLQTILRDLNIKRASGSAIKFVQIGGKHFIDFVQLRGNIVGVESDRGSLYITRCAMDKNERHINITDGELISVNESTFEQGGIVCNESRFFNFSLSKMSGGYFDVNAESVVFSQSKLNGQKPLFKSIPSHLVMQSNYIQPPSDFQKIKCSQYVQLTQNFTGRGVKLDNCK